MLKISNCTVIRVFHVLSPGVYQTIRDPIRLAFSSFSSAPLDFCQDQLCLVGCLIPFVFSGEKVVDSEAGVKSMTFGACLWG